MVNKMALIVFSGTVDKLLPVGIIASGGVAMDMEVHIFLTFWGLNAFRKDSVKSNKKFSKDFEEMAPYMMNLINKKGVPSYIDTIKQAKAIGNVHVHACAMTLDLMDMKKEDLDDIVEDVMGVGEFVELAKDGMTLFI
ncbi:MAG: DsrE/DsrF/DrsH-like family protein [Candidatus Thermoplasmatota archaeon]|jgi:peroxiredoxin family protein|nr:DsrE/DsrF/DrsH-like family protein [Candidatus Thermoplasmatota archaeon]MCL5962938.1 DsrE/DsrF/DrsH-like family protein [Candidatus Thermoplasmatota archaeon]